MAKGHKNGRKIYFHCFRRFINDPFSQRIAGTLAYKRRVMQGT